MFEQKVIGKFRCDLLIEDTVIGELKSVTGFMPKLFQNQLISYLKASKIKTGLLINFGNLSCEVKRLQYNSVKPEVYRGNFKIRVITNEN